MVKVIAKFFVKEDKVEEFLKLAGELVQESRKEAGCINYNLVQDLNNKQILVMLEEWESAGILKIHMASTHFTTIIPKMSLLQYQKEEIIICKPVF
ncbi:putative quinol monooxygenase [uncultured Bacteroides sp.]|uniref:putative quinol monooxygenase n=1 Tax=uncultured Bacteroides sp. TaxID=162156 RepID=UPI002AA821DD|nr:putative quinol monooxygenase [uncultured Bacteroides sp.]